VAAVAIAVFFSLLLWIVHSRGQRKLRAAEQAERLATERRDRFLGQVAAELDAPLAAGRVDEARRILSELARPQAAVAPEPREAVDVGEVVREIVEAPPFTDRGPSVILRAAKVLVQAERGRLANALKVLLWTLRREADDASPMVITVSGGDRALLEIDAKGTREAVEALGRAEGMMAGVNEAARSPGATLAMRVGAEVARAHGGRLSARATAGQGERYVLELPL
jgi:signal transduction histidine kinase